MNIKSYFQNNKASKLISILAVILIAIIIFQTGFSVGYHKASFINKWDDRYLGNPNYLKSAYSPFMIKKRGDEINPNGALGQIVSMSLPTFMVKGNNRAEMAIRINSNTSIRKMREMSTTTDLIIGKNVVIIGEPNNDGEIEAKLIRILPDKNFSPMPQGSLMK